MDDIQRRFEQAATEAQSLAVRPGNEILLKLYALYKQATVGDVQGKRPGFTNPVGRAKYDAWHRVKGTSRDDAMAGYVALVEEIKGSD